MTTGSDRNRADRPVIGRVIALLLGAGALTLVLFGLREARTLLVPGLLAGFLTIIVYPLVAWQTRRRVPAGLAILSSTLFLALVMLLLGALFGSSLDEFSGNLPGYEASVQEQLGTVLGPDGSLGSKVEGLNLLEQIDPGVVMTLASKMLSGLSDTLANSVLIFFLMCLIMLEVTEFAGKLEVAFGPSSRASANIDRLVKSVSHYVLLKALISLGTGVAAGILCAVVGVDFALLRGLLAFLLNFVPNIGSIIAAIPPVLLALVQYGPTSALIVGVGFLAINAVAGDPDGLGAYGGTAAVTAAKSSIGQESTVDCTKRRPAHRLTLTALGEASGRAHTTDAGDRLKTRAEIVPERSRPAPNPLGRRESR